MNPRIPGDYDEVGRWLLNFATSHAKRGHPALEVVVEMGAPREAHSYGLRLRLGGDTHPPPDAPATELTYTEVAEGRTRFAWCDALAQRIRADARRLTGVVGSGGSRTA